MFPLVALVVLVEEKRSVGGGGEYLLVRPVRRSLILS
jgi:hypothetical protein